MLKLSLRLLQDRKKEGKISRLEVKPELPAFEWQVTGETELEDCITQATATLSQPDDALFGTINERCKSSPTRSSVSKNLVSCNTESRRLRLMQIIEDENSRTRFRNYLVSQYCEENLDFYMDVCQYHEFFCSTRIHINDDIREISSHAKYIWNFYLDSDTSSKPLNVPQDLANSCQQKIHSRQYNIDIFDKLQQHCFDLMVQDSLPKFTRNSMIHESYSYSSLPSPTLSLNPCVNHQTEPNHLKPLSFVEKITSGPRKSLSSGSLKLKMTSTLASLKTAVADSSKTINDLDSSNKTLSSIPLSLNSPTLPSTNSLSQEIHMENSVTAITTSENSECNRSSMASTGSTNSLGSFNSASSTTLTISSNSAGSVNSTGSTLPTPTSIHSQRLSFTNITRRILSRRRNSLSLVLGQFSLSALNSHYSSNDRVMTMPGSYPQEDQEDRDGFEQCDESSDNATTWQKLRRNISTPNFQSQVTLRSRSGMNLHETYIPQKSLPPIPAASGT
ncbi:9259_t:CDS:2 [Acaulospora morrowiae]|uniref:9259_t:CDS:1 n=1 Tax=Acaulospora morrowiae TaxID=94023 RepID=A0A9N9AHJ2_9GLOM|nr:9259_t:CDS:2 [Acaulospora morrowiae]